MSHSLSHLTSMVCWPAVRPLRPLIPNPAKCELPVWRVLLDLGRISASSTPSVQLMSSHRVRLVIAGPFPRSLGIVPSDRAATGDLGPLVVTCDFDSPTPRRAGLQDDWLARCAAAGLRRGSRGGLLTVVAPFDVLRPALPSRSRMRKSLDRRNAGEDLLDGYGIYSNHDLKCRPLCPSVSSVHLNRL